MRLVYGPRSTVVGRLEIYLRGEWGTVCNPGGRSLEKAVAIVVCKQLGYFTAVGSPSNAARST